MTILLSSLHLHRHALSDSCRTSVGLSCIPGGWVAWQRKILLVETGRWEREARDTRAGPPARRAVNGGGLRRRARVLEELVGERRFRGIRR